MDAERRGAMPTRPEVNGLPPWPENPPASPATVARAALEDEAAELEERVARLAGDADPELRAAIDALILVQERRERAAESQVRGRLQVLARVNTELATLRQLPSTETMITAAPRSACVACGFDRAVLYRVRGQELYAEAFYVHNDPAAAERLLRYSREHPAMLVSDALETEMVRQRRPMAVQQVVGNPRAFAELTGAYDTHSYVAAPIMPEGRVIGFLHADHRMEPRRVDDFDRDALWAFAEGFGYAIERAQLVHRLRDQGRELRHLLRRTEAVVAEYLEAEVELGSEESTGAGATRTASAALLSDTDDSGLAATLSRRELEVLALLGDGASNAHIAARLVITEATAKSHVKRILRKLGARNRLEAATIWLKAQQAKG